jgi:methylmalonyl-CoA mutase N-terminal domain/subunit
VSREDYARSTVTSVVDWLVDRFPEPAMSYFAKVVEDDGNTAAAEELRQQVERLRIQER